MTGKIETGKTKTGTTPAGRLLAGMTSSRRGRLLGGALVLAMGAGALAVPALAERGPGGDAPRWGHHQGEGHRMGGAMGGRMMEAMPGFEELDADGDGSVTRDELDAWRQSRAAVDADGDGKISADELVAHEMARAEARIRAEVDRRIAAQDLDGDGMLDVDELLAAPMPFADRIFDRADADDDGAVSAEEFQAARDRMAEMRRDRVGHGPRGGMERGGPAQRMMPPPPADAPAPEGQAPDAAAPAPAPGNN